MRLPRCALVACALLLAGAEPTAAAEPTVLRWDYLVDLEGPDGGIARVTVTFTGLKGVVDRMSFMTERHSYPILGVRAGPGSTLKPVPGGVELPVASDRESFTFDVDVRRVASKPGEYNAFLGPEWGVFKAEAFALAFNYSYFAGTEFRWSSRMTFELPPGWRVEGSWERDGERGFLLPEGDTLPRGFVAAGPFPEPKVFRGGGKEFRYARLAKEGEFEKDLFAYVVAATPYYESVYGKDAAGARILVVSAPSPMFTGGLGGADSLYVHETADLRTLAHEYAHVWQLFGTVQDAGSSTIWFNEGDADYHGLLSLFASDFWSLDEVNDQLKRWNTERNRADWRDVRLTDAVYGPFEDLAYHKGALVLHALDRLIQEETSGAAGLPDLLQGLNAAHDQRKADTSREPVTNAELLTTLREKVRLDFSPFFSEYVTGTEWPTFVPATAGDTLVLTDLRLEPDTARQGETIRGEITVVNRGAAPAEKRIVVTLDGSPLTQRTVRLEQGRTEVVNFTLLAPAPGEHEVKALYLEKPLRVLRPPKLAASRVSSVPFTPEAGTPFDLLVYVENAGELPGTVTVTVREDGFLVADAQRLTVPGGITQAATLPVTLDHWGAIQFAIEVRGEGLDATLPFAFVVSPADRDRDGVPDPEDAYPENPRLQRKSTTSEVQNAVPGPAILALIAAATVAGLALRRR